MEENILVLSVGKPYNIPGENGAPAVTGCTMWYLPTGDLSKHFDNDTETIGYTPVKEKMPVNFYETAKAVGLPANARVVYGMKNSGGKQALYIKGLDFINVADNKK